MLFTLPRGKEGFSRLLRLILAAGMISQAWVLMVLDQRLRISRLVYSDGFLGHWPMLWIFFLLSRAHCP